jgi:hypothetical protein
MSTGGKLYNTFYKSNAKYVTYVVVGAVVLETVYSDLTDSIWESVNKGVSAIAVRATRRVCVKQSFILARVVAGR